MLRQSPLKPDPIMNADYLDTLRSMRPLISIAALVCGIVLLSACHAPSRVPVGKLPDRIPEQVTVVRFPGGDKDIELEGWWWEPKPDDKITGEALAEFYRRRDVTVIYCHGATECQDGLSTGLLLDAGYRVLTFDYRGFGNSTNIRMTNEGFSRDAAAALAYVRSRPDVDPQRVAVFGHSMGAAYALAMGAQANDAGQPMQAVVAASGFSSWRYAANAIIPVIGYVIAYADGCDPSDNIRRLGSTPVLITHFRTDGVMPVSNAKRLFAAAERAQMPVQLLIGEVGGHEIGYLMDEAFAAQVVGFIDQHTGVRHSAAVVPDAVGN